MNKLVLFVFFVLGIICSIKATAQAPVHKIQLDSKADSIQHKTMEKEYGMRFYNTKGCYCLPMLATLPKPDTSTPYNFPKERVWKPTF